MRVMARGLVKATVRGSGLAKDWGWVRGSGWGTVRGLAMVMATGLGMVRGSVRDWGSGSGSGTVTVRGWVTATGSARGWDLVTGSGSYSIAALINVSSGTGMCEQHVCCQSTTGGDWLAAPAAGFIKGRGKCISHISRLSSAERQHAAE